MKAQSVYLMKLSFLVIALLLLRMFGFGQGRVVINEYMPWASCSTTSEYIELMNFGPGPMNIGCYIVTNGNYAVTIPANTMLQPGSYYVISGQSVLPRGCGNIDSSITVNLNWNTCNCTDKAVPTTGDGFMQNGGSANEKIVLLTPGLSVVDAVSRSVPVTPSVSITTSTNSGACTASTFDLDNLPISYEAINVSTGIDNSYSRRVDGDCGWVKTTDISAGAPNKTGSTSSATYNFSTLSASECSGSTGSISIAVGAPDVSSLFPMTYTLAYDADSNGVFNSNDLYRHGVDSSASSIDINNLAYGRYRITVGSSSGCNLQSFDFFIFNCYGVVLPYGVSSFRYSGITESKHSFTATIAGLQHVKSIQLQAILQGVYKTVNTIDRPNYDTDRGVFKLSAPLNSAELYRIKLLTHSNAEYYSNELLVRSTTENKIQAWPNPAYRELFIQLPYQNSTVTYLIMNAAGRIMSRGEIQSSSVGQIRIPLSNLPPGSYKAIVSKLHSEQRHSLSFMKR